MKDDTYIHINENLPTQITLQPIELVIREIAFSCSIIHLQGICTEKRADVSMVDNVVVIKHTPPKKIRSFSSLVRSIGSPLSLSTKRNSSSLMASTSRSKKRPMKNQL